LKERDQNLIDRGIGPGFTVKFAPSKEALESVSKLRVKYIKNKSLYQYSIQYTVGKKTRMYILKV